MKRYDVLAVGVCAVDELLYVVDYPTINSKIPVIAKSRQGGGPACTAAATVARLGGRAAFLARLGDDGLSTYLTAALKQRGVDVSHVLHDPDGAPYHSVIVVDRHGNRNVFYDASFYREIAAHDVPEDIIRSSALCVFDHLKDPAPLALLARARSYGTPVLVDIEGRSPSSLKVAELADYLVVPEQFAIWATEASSPQEACRRLSGTQRIATVVTSGSNGCYYTVGKDTAVQHRAAFQVNAFDTNGCGDTFHGAFSLAVARGIKIPAALTFASAAAALKASAAGGKLSGWDALPDLGEVHSLLRSQLGASDKAILMSDLAPLQV